MRKVKKAINVFNIFQNIIVDETTFNNESKEKRI